MVDADVDAGPSDSDNLKWIVGERIRTARKALGFNQEQFAEETGIPVSTLRGYEKGQRLAGGDAIASLICCGINANWLLTGDGQMFLQATDVHSGKAAYPSHEASALDQRQETAGYVALPLYNNVRAAAGHGAINGIERADDALMFKEDWIRFELGARPEDLCLIRVSGDSMEPTLRAGDVILVDHRTCRPDREGIYILRLGEMLLVKRVQALPGGVIKISSDNAAFDSWTLNVADVGADVAIIGRVVWSGRRI